MLRASLVQFEQKKEEKARKKLEKEMRSLLLEEETAMQSEDVDNTMGMFEDEGVENDFMNDLTNVLNDSSDSSSS